MSQRWDRTAATRPAPVPLQGAPRAPQMPGGHAARFPTFHFVSSTPVPASRRHPGVRPEPALAQDQALRDESIASVRFAYDYAQCRNLHSPVTRSPRGQFLAAVRCILYLRYAPALYRVSAQGCSAENLDLSGTIVNNLRSLDRRRARGYRDLSWAATCLYRLKSALPRGHIGSAKT